MSPSLKKALRGLAAPASREADPIPEPELIARPRPRLPAEPPASAVLKPLPMDAPAPSGSAVLKPLPMEAPAAPAVLRHLPVDEPARAPYAPSRRASPDDEQPPERTMPRRFEPQDDAGPPQDMVMSRVPRPVLKVGPSFAATFGLVTFSQMASALLAGAAGAGSVFAVARIVSPGVAEIPALCIFGAVLAIWLPAAVRLASSAAWRGTLREPGVARGLAEGIAWAVLPRTSAADPSGLGLYGLRERVRLGLEQALFESVRTAWVRRCVTQVAANRAEERMHQTLGPVEGYGQLDRDTVRKALTNAIEGALTGS